MIPVCQHPGRRRSAVSPEGSLRARLPGRQKMYSSILAGVYTQTMDVAITELRANLSLWLDQARSGHEVVITDRGVPVARLMGLNTTATLERLTAEGVISLA